MVRVRPIAQRARRSAVGLVIAVLAAWLNPSVAWTQGPPASLVGDRVRLTALLAGERQSITGSVLRIDEHAVSLDRDGTTQEFPLVQVERIERSLGLHRRAGRGAWMGALIGAGAGALVGALAFAGDAGSDVLGQISAAEGAGAGAVLGLGAGAVIGVTVGALSKKERWETVPPDRWARNGPRSSLRLGLAIPL